MPLTAVELTAIGLISSHVPAASALITAVRPAQAVGLLTRDATTCADASLTPCGSSLPSNFCCPSSTTCIALSDASSAICCPAGQDCSYIAPITCDISKQDAALHPANQIHTSNLTAKLPTCGSFCCPLGYGCQNGMCVMAPRNKPSTIIHPSASPTSSSVSTASHIAVILTTPVPTPTSAASTSSPPTTASPQSTYPARAVLAGLFPGLIFGVLITILAVFLLRRRRAAYQETPDLTCTKRTVSDPIYRPSFNGNRTDFLMRHNNNNQPDFTFQFLPRTPSRRLHHVKSQRSMRSLLATSSVYPSVAHPSPPLLPQTTFTPPRSTTKKDPRTPLRGMPRMPETPPTMLTPVRTAPKRDPIGRSIPTSHPSTPGSSKEASFETIDVLMPPTAGLQPPPVLWMRERDWERPDSGRTSGTTFSGIMDRAGLGKYYSQHMPPGGRLT